MLLTGHNGAGKSSVFRCLAGLWKIPEGQIQKPGSAKGNNSLAGTVFYLPQKPYNGKALCHSCSSCALSWRHSSPSWNISNVITRRLFLMMMTMMVATAAVRCLQCSAPLSISSRTQSSATAAG